ncbi:MAG: transposase zinc-binding domain-containing protein [Verrucomicrobiae bacterium]|nr:transposase zinc-binding domain-containing protein [Verrucomicrobiae bacterium]
MCSSLNHVPQSKVESPSVTDVIRFFAPAYIDRYGDVMTLNQRRALSNILQCRTNAMGGEVYTCEECHRKRYLGYR